MGVAVITTLFVQQTAHHAAELQGQPGAALPPGVIPDPNDPAFVAARDHLLAAAGTAGTNDVFVFVTIGTLVVLLLATFLPGRNRQSETPAPSGEPAHPPALATE
jgi:hypothetical protein